ncbi:MAG: toll/interleukin-1 receptor domain-containing protein [Bacteroidetes bacterium]|nr:toll/interleukin-1 receptor domain-containing protein [Bacteroidota bacterium]MCW5897266.1 toll/interleukin-1 receptor domain-containing protein [Bacteroidota bacterium]
MNDRDWRTLVHNIETGSCILVLGPDAATEKVSGEFRTLNRILANKLADELSKDHKVLDPDDLLTTAQQYADFTSEEDLRLDTADYYKNRKVEVDALHADLAQLPFQLVVNACHDSLFLQALEKAGKKYATDLYNYRGEPRDMVRWESRTDPFVYSLYGSTAVHESLVITEKHFLEFLVAITTKDPPIHNNIMSEFRDKNKSFLFVGFGFRNWYLRILLYILLNSKTGKSEKTSRSFALEPDSPENASLAQVSFLFKDSLKINFSDRAVGEFVNELRSRFEAQVQSNVPQSSSNTQEPPVEEVKEKAVTQSTSMMDDISGDAPTIFICHASEDKETAMRIWQRLHEAGMNPWIDKEGIRGGDQWDQLLEKQIKGVDYFLVVQSNALAAKGKQKSYVNKEIKLALEERLEFPDQITFILPVKIEQCELREEFSTWQCTDLTDFSNIESLLKDIRRDQQRRKK